MAEKEHHIYEPLERWINSSFSKSVYHSKKTQHVEITINKSYFFSEDRKARLYPDVSAIDNNGKLIIFECKAKDPLRSKQLIDYLSGTNFLYSVVKEQTRHLSQRQAMLKSIGIGLITFRKYGKEHHFTVRHESKDHMGALAKPNMGRLKRVTKKVPRIIIFPHDKKFFPTKQSMKKRIIRCKKGDTYYHRVSRTLPSGSIVLFAYGNEIVGQAVIKKNRKPTEEEREKGKEAGYEPLFVLEPFPDLVSVFPRPVKYRDLKSLPSFVGKPPHSVIKGYPYISKYEYFLILNKVLSQ